MDSCSVLVTFQKNSLCRYVEMKILNFKKGEEIQVIIAIDMSWSTLATGQLCSKGGRVFAEEGERDQACFYSLRAEVTKNSGRPKFP